MSLFEALILGIVQGATEFLPISSSGHLVIARAVFGLQESPLVFDLLLHLATLAAVFIFFWKDILALRFKDLLLMVLATIPAALAGIFFKDQLESLFTFPLFVGFEFLINAVINFVSASILLTAHSQSWWGRLTARIQSLAAESKPGVGSVTTKQAILVGIAQAVAISPGISRSGSTVAVGLLSGLSREHAFRFSFLISIPAIGGAAALQLLDVIQEPTVLPGAGQIIIGLLASFSVGLLSLQLLKLLMVKAQLYWFALYCFIAGIAVIVWQLSLS